MRIPVPENSRLKTQRARRAKKTSAGIISAEVACCFVQLLKATASSQVFRLPLSKKFDCAIWYAQLPENSHVELVMIKDHTDFCGRRIFYLRHEHLVHQAFRIKICCHKRPYIGPSAKHNDGVRRRNRIRHDPKIGRTLQQRLSARATRSAPIAANSSTTTR